MDHVYIAERSLARGSAIRIRVGEMTIFNLYTRKYLTNRKYGYDYTVNHN